MSVVQLDFYDREDINGAVVFSITEEDSFFEGFEQRISLRDLGSGLIKLSRQKLSSEAPFLYNIAQTEAFVRVLVPAISSDYLFGFFIDSRKQTVLSQEEQGGIDVHIGGSGPLYYLSRAILWQEAFSDTHAQVQTDNGIWVFPDEWTPGRVASTLLAEDANNTHAQFIGALTRDFDNTVDSDGNVWTDTFEEGLRIPIGAHYLHVVRMMQEAAVDLDTFIDVGSPGSPQMLWRMFNRYGRDLTTTEFATGKVLFKGGISGDPLSGNILTGLEQEGNSTRRPSHVLVRGPEGTYKTVEANGWDPGELTKAVSVEYDNTSGETSLFRFGRRFIQSWNDRGEAIQLEIHPGFDEAAGHYMPGPPGSDGHFWIGDDITLKTGPDVSHSVLDYHYTSERVTGIRMVMDEAVRDDSDTTRALSWHIVPELNETFGLPPGDLTGGVGICCGPSAPSAPSNPTVIASGSISFDSATNESEIQVPAGADLYAIVGSVGPAGPDLSWLPDYAGSGSPGTDYALTLVAESEGDATGDASDDRIQLFRLLDPEPSSTANSRVGIANGADGFPVNVALFVVAGRGSDSDTAATGTGTSTAPSVTVGGSGGLILDGTFWQQWPSPGVSEPAANSGQTEVVTTSGTHASAGATGFGAGYGGTSPAAWTLPSSRSWRMVGVRIPGTSGHSTEPVGDTGDTGDSTGTYSPIDHVHAHGTFASGDYHTEYVREADANWVDLTDGGETALHTHAASGVTDHGDLTGLADDDHTHYLTEARHDAHSHETIGHWEPVTNGDTANPEVVFDDGDIVMEWTT